MKNVKSLLCNLLVRPIFLNFGDDVRRLGVLLLQELLQVVTLLLIQKTVLNLKQNKAHTMELFR